MVQHDSKIPYSEQANIEIDREIVKGLTVSAGYLWVSAHHLVRAENLNVCPPFGAAAGTTVPSVTPGTPACPPAEAPPTGTTPPTVGRLEKPFSTTFNPGGSPAYGNSGLLYYTDNTGNSNYNGLTLQLNYDSTESSLSMPITPGRTRSTTARSRRSSALPRTSTIARWNTPTPTRTFASASSPTSVLKVPKTVFSVISLSAISSRCRLRAPSPCSSASTPTATQIQ